MGLAKYQDRKNTAVPNWVRYSGIALAAIFAVAGFLIFSGIAGQHWQHITHSLNKSDMSMAYGTKP